MLRATVGLICWIALSLLAGVVGGVATGREAGAFYRELELPPFAPPGWVFGPVWTLLYLLMGVAVWLVWKPSGFAKARLPLSLFGVQLVLNALWSWIFFAWWQPGWALVEIVVLWLAIVATTIAFWRVRPTSGALLLPYLAWVSFAVVLNAAIWWLNA
ncbi:TspO/MBR family protein [Phycisphaerales bacterium AB-hyl4]|uniref:TspO/MBR family protein n=1 Tax=Natronomicrosphaera hydrolytica TaxID=3242702 RepID=A0ABV4U1C2_9BACT